MNGGTVKDEDLYGWEREVDLEGEMTTKRIKSAAAGSKDTFVAKCMICKKAETDITEKCENTWMFAFSLISKCKVKARTQNLLSKLADFCIINH